MGFTDPCELHDIICCRTCKDRQIEATRRSIKALQKSGAKRMSFMAVRSPRTWTAKYHRICHKCDKPIVTDQDQVCWDPAFPGDDQPLVIHEDCF